MINSKIKLEVMKNSLSKVAVTF